MRQHGQDHLRVVAVSVGEERADRTVDEAGDQRLALGGTALAFEIAARNAAGREGLFLIVYGKREKVLTWLWRLGGNHCREHGRLAPTRHHGAVGLPGDLAGLEHELTPGPIEFFAVNLEHAGLSLMNLRFVMSKTARSCGSGVS